MREPVRSVSILQQMVNIACVLIQYQFYDRNRTSLYVQLAIMIKVQRGATDVLPV